jgi:hypothetical protein
MAKPRKLKNTKRRYEPDKGTKRWYYIQALKQGGTSDEIKKRAIELAKLDGKTFTKEDFRDMRLNWVVTFLRQRGAAVLYEGDSVRVFA